METSAQRRTEVQGKRKELILETLQLLSINCWTRGGYSRRLHSDAADFEMGNHEDRSQFYIRKRRTGLRVRKKPVVSRA